MSVSAQRSARIAFATVVAVVIVQLPLTAWQRSEPYPAIFLPAFPLVNGKTERAKATVTVHFAGGDSAAVDFVRILPETPFEPLGLASATFQDDDIAADPEIVSWLQSRIAEQFPGQTPVSADIEWDVTAYRGAQETRRPLKTIHVELA